MYELEVSVWFFTMKLCVRRRNDMAFSLHIKSQNDTISFHLK